MREIKSKAFPHRPVIKILKSKKQKKNKTKKKQKKPHKPRNLNLLNRHRNVKERRWEGFRKVVWKAWILRMGYQAVNSSQDGVTQQSKNKESKSIQETISGSPNLAIASMSL